MAKADKDSTTYLKCTKNGANKFYNLEIVPEGGQFRVRCHWGRIGNKGSYQDKGLHMNWQRAEAEVKRITAQKKSKGYEDVSAAERKKLKATKAKKPAAPKPKEVSLGRFADLLE